MLHHPEPRSGEVVVSKKYKYLMVFLCMLTQAIPYEVAQTIQPLFVHPIVNTFHFTLASYTLIFTFGAVAASFTSPFIGKGLEKFNFKLMYIGGIVLSALAYVLFGFSTRLPEFYAAGILCMIGSTFYSGQGVPWVINHWFPFEGRGAALGIAFCGGSIGNIFMQPVTQALLSRYMTGNAKTGHLISMAPFFYFAGLLLVVGLIIACFIRTPKKGETVVSAAEIKASKASAAKKKASEFQGWTSKEVFRMKEFWIFSIGFLIIGLGLASLNEDYAAFLDTKLALTKVGLIGSMFGVGGLIGNITGGMLFDKFGTAKSMAYAGVMYVLAILMMIIISFLPFGNRMNMIAGFGYAIFTGLAVFSYMSGPAFMAKDLFGAKEQGVMLGYVGLAYAIGFAVGAPLFGMIRDNTSFTVAWSVMLVFVVIGFLLLVSAAVRIKHRQKVLINNGH
ncbi:conjugated bile salt MFS transporter [Limosilactobacillus antri]|uniref:conjugated bile salt MFS transporter n=1 Tax=Limosilactobacillus antri TaxID=227943 RepID=UPI001F57977E|nr:conjugated bile salt MFS transporter [Limosilactobacillus antri]